MLADRSTTSRAGDGRARPSSVSTGSAQRPWRGTIVARGDGKDRPYQVRVGDLVVFPAGCGQGLRLRLNGQEHVLVRERDALGVIEDTDEIPRPADG